MSATSGRIGHTRLVRDRATLATSHGPGNVSPIEVARRGLRMAPDSTDDEVRAQLAAIGHGALAAAKKPALTPEQLEIAKSYGITSEAGLAKYAADLSAQAEREAARKAARAANDAAIKKALAPKKVAK